MKTKINLPEGLSKETKSFMKNVLKRLNESNAIRDVDAGALRMLAVSYEIYFKSYDSIQNDGMMLHIGDKPIANPLLDTMQKAYIQTIKFLTEYGMTLKSSEKIKTLNPEVDADNPLAKFLNGSI
jgi:P27 family predicted phage terminase small subunit